MTSPVPSRPARAVIIALGAYALAVLVVLLVPLGYSELVRAIGDGVRAAAGMPAFGDGWIEAGANVVLFVPLGALLALLFRRRWQGIALALVLSAAAELAQALMPSREPSLRDVAANVLGAALGAALAWLAAARRTGASVAKPSAQSLDSAGQRVPPLLEAEATEQDPPH
ncbi:VanZ family protein [Agrococcus pavilionensis]|uniref:VanZ family protein n=1 Tax=Agrococcus pavilionensis TaxID=1346502 RepID=UPI0009DC1B06|nr:VanZ family protein [Agrococcus pavilionensis]